MIRFQGCSLQLNLEAQSPLIHFQHGQPGATVRASEVKPKLDRFILTRVTRETGKTIDELRKTGEYEGVFVDESHNALAYKMQINANVTPDTYLVVDIGKKDQYEIFYGNSGRDEPIKAVFSNPVVTIKCFHQKLKKLIEKYIVEFFLVTNFGTMQSKGFGSFAPVEERRQLTLEERRKIAKYLKEETGSARCYCMEFEKIPDNLNSKNAFCQKMFTQIKSFYSIMKSGQNFRGYSRSYIYQYMHRKQETDRKIVNKNNVNGLSIDNEKAWMKQQGIAPADSKPENRQKQDRKAQNPRYVRALLGTAGKVSFRTGQFSVKIQDKSEGVDPLDRVPSPILFKIVQNVVFIVAREVPEEIYDREFEFSSSWKSGKIQTPSRADFENGKFDIQEFLSTYIEYYNSSELRENLKMLQRYKLVKEVN